MEIEQYLSRAFWESAESCCLSEAGDEVLSDFEESRLLFMTSGSSGVSKWVVHTKRGLLSHSGWVNEHLAVVENDIFGLVLPVYHVGGFGVIARAYVSGASLVQLAGKWSAQACVEMLERDGVTILSLVPAQLVDLVSEEISCPDSVRAVIVGGGRLDEEVKKAAVLLGWPIMGSYGMTETGSQIATCKGAGSKFFETGYLALIDGWEVRVNDSGVLEVKSECLFEGYLMNEGAELIDPKQDGWFTTTDRVELVQDGDEVGVKFLGRSDQQVKILGGLVNVAELEGCLCEELDADVKIVSVRDLRRGVKLVPVTDDDSLRRSIDELNWSGLHRLEASVLVDSFPRNAMGKLQRPKLVEMVESIVFSAD